MQGVNMQTLVHVGAELVIAAGMAFWIQRKTSILSAEVARLQKQVDDYENIFKNQQQLLDRHDQILRHLLGGPPQQNTQMQQQNTQMQQQNTQMQQNVQQQNTQMQQNVQQQNVQQQNTQTSMVAQQETLSEVDPEELDLLLIQELNELDEEKEIPEYIEIEEYSDLKS